MRNACQLVAIHQDLGGGRKGVYRPHFVGYLGKGEYLLCWSESQPYDGGPEVIYGRTRDFRTVVRDLADTHIGRWATGWSAPGGRATGSTCSPGGSST